MKYRLAQERDIRQIAELRWIHKVEEDHETAMTSKTDFIEAFTQYLKDNLGNYLEIMVAEHNGIIYSNAFLRIINKIPKPSKFDSKLVYISGVFTLKEGRGKGIGSGMLSEIKEWMVKEGVETVFLWSSKAARKFYEKNEFLLSNEVYEFPED